MRVEQIKDPESSWVLCWPLGSSAMEPAPLSTSRTHCPPRSGLCRYTGQRSDLEGQDLHNIDPGRITISAEL